MAARNHPPEHLPPDLRDHPAVIAACRERDIGKLFRIVNNLTTKPTQFTASHIARQCALTPTRVSEYMNGRRNTMTAEVIERVADGLRIPGSYFHLAPRPWEDASPTDQPPLLPPGPAAQPAEFWQHPAMRTALDSWHIGRVIRAYRTHSRHKRDITQKQMATWLNIDQGQLSRIESGRAPEELSKLTHWATVLKIPPELLWFKLLIATPSEATEQPSGNQRLRQVRTDRGWSAADVAARIRAHIHATTGQHVTVDADLIERLEKGEVIPLPADHRAALRALYAATDEQLGLTPDRAAKAHPKPTLNTEIRARRIARRWTQQQAAEAVAAAVAHTTERGAPHGIDAQYIARLERGEIRWPNADYRAALRSVYRATTDAELGLVGIRLRPGEQPVEPDTREQGRSDGSEEPSEDDMRRRAFLGVAAGLAAAPLSDPYERLLYALQHPTRTDAETVSMLESATADYFDREEHTPARQLIPDLGLHINTLSELLSGTTNEQLRRRLAITAGESSALAGWLAWDTGDPARARRYWDAAVHAARQSEDGPLLACTLAYLSYMASSHGEKREAWRLLDSAQEHVRDKRNAQARSWIAARAAEEAASLGDSRALICLERAFTAYDYADPATARPWARFFDNARLGSMAVATYGHLNHPALPEAAGAVLSSLRPDEAKTKAVILGDVALAYVRRGDVEQGCALAEQALDVTLSSEATLGRQRLSALTPLLSPHSGATPVRHLSERLAALG